MPPNILQMLLEFQLAIHRLSRGPVLNLAESHLLSFVRYSSANTLTKLAEAMSLDKSSVSRSLHALERKKMLVLKPDSHDSRKRYISLTKKGERLLSKDLDWRSETTASFQAFLSESEREDLYSCFKMIADGVSVGPIVLIPDELALRTIQRRLSRAFGLLTDNVLDSGITAVALQILLVLQRSAEHFTIIWHSSFLTFQELNQEISVPASTLQRNLKELTKKGLVRAHLFKGDRKRPSYMNTQKAEQLFTTLNQRLASYVLRGEHARGEPIDITGVIRSIRKIHRIKATDTGISDYTVVRAHELGKCRAFIVQTLSRELRLEDTPEILCERKRRHYWILMDKEIALLVSLPSSAQDAVEVCHDSRLMTRRAALEYAEEIVSLNCSTKGA